MKEIKEKDKHKIIFKIKFYIMSLTLLFFLLFILNFRLEMFKNFTKDLLNSLLTVGSFTFMVIGLISYASIKYEWKGSKNPAYKVIKIKSENFEYLTFLTTYIIPLIFFDMEKTRYVIVICIILIIVGIIFVRMDLYYGNPTLALMGYRLYTVYVDDDNYPDGIMVIARGRIKKNSYIQWLRVDENFWVIKEV